MKADGYVERYRKPGPVYDGLRIDSSPLSLPAVLSGLAVLYGAAFQIGYFQSVGIEFLPLLSVFLLPLVDSLTTMGYEETGAHAKQWRSYAFQKKAAGELSGKLLMGLPSNKDRWQDESVVEQLRWIADDKRVGLAFWDAQVESPAWRKREVWSVIQTIRDGK